MPIRFEHVVEANVERLVDWLPKHTWPHHGRARVDETWVRERIATGYFSGQTARSVWMMDDACVPVALLRVFDLGDITPLVDIRVGNTRRGRGLGTLGLGWLTRFVFDTFPEAHRLGGYTRFDNAAMRRVFDKCGFAEEARHRQAWPLEGGGFLDTVGYGILRSELPTRLSSTAEHRP